LSAISAAWSKWNPTNQPSHIANSPNDSWLALAFSRWLGNYKMNFVLSWPEGWGDIGNVISMDEMPEKSEWKLISKLRAKDTLQLPLD